LAQVDPSERGSVKSLAANSWFDFPLLGDSNDPPVIGAAGGGVGGGAAAAAGADAADAGSSCAGAAATVQVLMEDEACAVAFMSKAAEMGERAKEKEV